MENVATVCSLSKLIACSVQDHRLQHSPETADIDSFYTIKICYITQQPDQRRGDTDNNVLKDLIQDKGQSYTASALENIMEGDTKQPSFTSTFQTPTNNNYACTSTVYSYQ